MFDNRVIGGCPDSEFSDVTAINWKIFNLLVGPLLAKWREVNRWIPDTEILEVICPRPVRWIGSVLIFCFGSMALFAFFLADRFVPESQPQSYKLVAYAIAAALLLICFSAALQIHSQVYRRRKNSENLRWFFSWAKALQHVLKLEKLNQLCAMSWASMQDRALDCLLELALAYVSEADENEANVIFMDLELAYKVLKSWQLISDDYGLQEFIDRIRKPLAVVLISGPDLTQTSG